MQKVCENTKTSPKSEFYLVLCKLRWDEIAASINGATVKLSFPGGKCIGFAPVFADEESAQELFPSCEVVKIDTEIEQ